MARNSIKLRSKPIMRGAVFTEYATLLLAVLVCSIVAVKQFSGLVANSFINFNSAITVSGENSNEWIDGGSGEGDGGDLGQSTTGAQHLNNFNSNHNQPPQHLGYFGPNDTSKNPVHPTGGGTYGNGQPPITTVNAPPEDGTAFGGPGLP